MTKEERKAKKVVDRQLRSSRKSQEKLLRREKKESVDQDDRTAVRRSYMKKSAGRYETISAIRTMIMSTVMIIVAFIVIELILFAVSGSFGDRDTHLLNLADNSLAFAVGLAAMDALTFFNQSARAKRNEERAIIRHNRIIQPAADMYLARKNMMITPDGEDVRRFRVISHVRIRDMKDLYEPSSIASDAGKSRIVVFKELIKSVNKGMMNMVEDIDFAYNQEICDAALKFINATTYGSGALDALIMYGEPGNRAKKMAVIKQIKEAPDDGTLADAKDELRNVYLVKQMIEEQEAALKEYIESVYDVVRDEKNAKMTIDHYE